MKLMKMNPAHLLPGASLAITLLFAPSVARAQTAAPVTAPAQPAPSQVNIPLVVLPFVLENDLIVLSLPMTQAGQGDKFRVPKEAAPFRLVLDSGADFSVLAEEAFAARKIPLPSPKQGESGVELNGIGSDNSRSARYISDIQFTAGNVSLKDTPALTPLGTLYKAGIDGILGANVFRTCVVEVDYASQTIRLFAPNSFMPPASSSGFVRIPIQIVSGTNRVTVPVEVTPFGFGKVTAHLEVDTGSYGTVAFATPFVKQNKWDVFAPRTIEMQSEGLAGTSNSRRGRLKELRFGSVALAAPYADFSFDAKGLMTDARSDGIIGGAILSRFTVIFDYSRSALYVRPNADAHVPFPFQVFGFETEHTPNAAGGLLLVQVDADSPMSRAGIKTGEAIFAVDNKPVGKLTSDEFSHLLDAHEGERLFSVGDANGQNRRNVRVLPVTL